MGASRRGKLADWPFDRRSLTLTLNDELVRELLRFSRCELLLLEAGSWGWGEFGKPEEAERPPLEAAIKQRRWRRDCGHQCV
jgi:hypothetical protein